MILFFDGGGNHAGEAVLHSHFVLVGVEANDEIVGSLVVRGALESLLIMSNSLTVLPKLDIGVTDILGDFKSHFLRCVWQDVQGHLVHLDRSRIFLLVVVDVSHVDPYSSSKGVLLSFDNFVVFCQSLLEHTAGLETERVIEGHSEGQLHVNEIRSV